MTAAIGMTTGAGLFALSIMGTILVLLCLETMHIIMGSVGNRNVFLKLSAQSPKDVQDLLNRFKEWSVVVDSFKQEESTVNDERRYIVSMELNMRRRQFEDHLYDMLQTDETIQVLELV